MNFLENRYAPDSVDPPTVIAAAPTYLFREFEFLHYTINYYIEPYASVYGRVPGSRFFDFQWHLTEKVYRLGAASKTWSRQWIPSILGMNSGGMVGVWYGQVEGMLGALVTFIKLF